MPARPSPLFDTSWSALLLLVGPGGGPGPATPVSVTRNALRSNDLPTDIPERESATWLP